MTSKRFYDAYSSGYATYLERHTGYFRAVEKEIATAAGNRRGLALLDVGTGTGERLQRIISAIHPDRVAAIDESPDMAALAQRNCPSAQVLAIPLSAPELPGELSDRFDLVTCLSNVLGHIPKAQLIPALKQVRSLMKPDGVFIFDVNNRYNAATYGPLSVIRNMARDRVLPGGGDFTAAYRNGDEVLQTPVHLFSPSEVARMLRESGLKAAKIGFRDYVTGQERGRFGGSIVVKAVSV
ncbi:class I SAM-dependent methyltransferase [Streptomyces inusitatus]|uniref:class I SAM-dependent methyltransferase n=1 Tax=Streptomyces inusitatus TaxID=68221 RepID=UPI00167E4A86|nr:class I SAM-dependent methyltransferase [Streptomyces inusitatus]